MLIFLHEGSVADDVGKEDGDYLALLFDSRGLCLEGGEFFHLRQSVAVVADNQICLGERAMAFGPVGLVGD